MEKQEDSQLELFSEPKDALNEKNWNSNSFFGYLRHYEKVILLIICLIIASAISFSLGVEKGKQFSFPKIENQPKLIAKQPDTKPSVILNKTPVETLKKSEKIQGFTIQIASYQNKERARKEAENLKNKGFSPLIIPNGNYNILCVGNFINKETAKPLLTELKRKYRDSFIRGL